MAIGIRRVKPHLRCVGCNTINPKAMYQVGIGPNNIVVTMCDSCMYELTCKLIKIGGQEQEQK